MGGGDSPARCRWEWGAKVPRSGLRHGAPPIESWRSGAEVGGAAASPAGGSSPRYSPGPADRCRGQTRHLTPRITSGAAQGRLGASRASHQMTPGAQGPASPGVTLHLALLAKTGAGATWGNQPTGRKCATTGPWGNHTTINQRLSGAHYGSAVNRPAVEPNCCNSRTRTEPRQPGASDIPCGAPCPSGMHPSNVV